MEIVTLTENTAGRVNLIAEWGLSIFVNIDGLGVLLDTGQSSALLHNASILGIDLRSISRIVLSHGHSDHTGGLRDLLKAIGREVEIIAHPDVWQEKYVKRPGEETHTFIGIPYRKEELEGLGACFILTTEPVWLNDRVVATGEIPMSTEYEFVDTNLYVKEGDHFVPDSVTDDMSLVIKTDDGLVVIAGCAHRGIINTLRHAQKLTGVENIDTVIGGTHLIRATPEQMELTIAELKGYGIRRLGPSHCTGFYASIRLAQEFEGAFFLNNAGTKLTLP